MGGFFFFLRVLITSLDKWEAERGGGGEKSMSTFPYVDISHKNMASAFDGALRRPDCVFIYLFRGRLPPSLARARLCERTGPAGTRPGRGPGSAGLRRAGAACVCSPPSPPPPRSRVSPLPVTIRRNVVAGSMTPWAEARLSAHPLLAAAGGAGGRAGSQATCRAGRAGARRCPHTPRSGAGKPRGEGGG